MGKNILSFEAELTSSKLQRSAARASQPILDSAAFPEQLFAPRADRRVTYAADVAFGYRAMQRQRVVLAGLARDVAPILPTTIARVERQGEMFGDYRVVIFENDSADETPDLLQDWADRNPRVTVVSEKLNDPVNQPTRCLDRASRMAHYRTQCQQVIASQFPTFDHVILIDTDLCGGWSYDGVAHTFAQGDWDFVGANGLIYRRYWLCPNRVVQYDAWAYREDELFTPLSTKHVNHLSFRRGDSLHPVFSCFGGVGIYRMTAYLAGRYDGSDVEHVTFHQVLHRQGFTRTFLNPSLIALYGRKQRTMDRYVRPMILCVDRLTFRQPTTWHFDAA